ncbi:MAG: hypothetical protein ABW252_16855 [Polyangiales bacterium]
MSVARCLIVLSLFAGAACSPRDAVAPRVHAQASPYVDQVDSPIRGLSAQEIDDLRNGRGMGLARAAELNGHPGPRHVLELRRELGVDDALAARIEAIVARMSSEARALGATLLTQEAALSQSFATGSVSAASLAAETEALGVAYGKLRALHLAAHLETRALLTPTQVARYAVLRGYTQPATPTGVHAGHAGH